MRSAVGHSIVWVIEICEYSLLFITFLGTAWLLRRDGHVKIDLVVNRLRPRVRAVVSVIISIIGTAVCLVITWYGAETTWSHFIRGTYRITLLETPMYLILAVIPIGSFLISIQFFSMACRQMKNWRSIQMENQNS